MGTVRALALAALLMAACSSRDSPATTSVLAPSTTPPPTSPESTISTALTARSVFEVAAPAMVFVETEIGTGSGFVYDAGHVVTNAHVVRPYARTRVVFPGRGEFDDVPVVGWDLISDLAILAVEVPADAAPLARGSTTGLAGGDRVYLVGYPLADPKEPEPQIVEGVLSRRPTVWPETGLSFLQTDAAIEDGQSGGLLVSGSGAMLGVTGTSRGVFAVALAIEDVIGRIDRLIAGVDVDGLDDRLLPMPIDGAPTTAVVEIRHRADVRTWVLGAGQGDPPASATMSSTGTGFLVAAAAAGHLVHASGAVAVTEAELKVDFTPPGPYMLVIEPDTSATFEIEASVGLTVFTDPDDGREVAVGDTVIGVADYAGDIDWITIDLAAGDSIVVRSSSASVDMLIFIDQPGTHEVPLAVGSNTFGPAGFNNEVAFIAEAAGSYLIVSSDALRTGSGAYLVTITTG
jgi:hypothetical protein